MQLNVIFKKKKFYFCKTFLGNWKRSTERKNGPLVLWTDGVAETLCDMHLDLLRSESRYTHSRSLSFSFPLTHKLLSTRLSGIWRESKHYVPEHKAQHRQPLV